MKFSNGYWLTKEDLQYSCPKQVYSITKKKAGVEIIVSAQPVLHRGDALQGPVLTYFISSPMKDIIKVSIEHYKGSNDKMPQFELQQDDHSFWFSENEAEAVFKAGDLALTIKKQGDFALYFTRGNKKLTGSFGRGAAYIQERNNVFLEEKLEKAYMKEALSLAMDEKLYGFGERFTPIVRNGQRIECWNEDGGTVAEQAYKNIPFYVSSRDYGVLVDHTQKVSFEAGSEIASKVQFSVKGEKLSYYVIAGDSMKQVLSNYTALSGRPDLPPAWSFGLWLSTSFSTDYNEQSVLEMIDEIEKKDIPLSVFHFDGYWMKGYHWSNFLWNEELFPDPKGMIKKIHEKGIKVCVWINPYIGQASELFEEGMEKGYFLRRKDGSVWQCDLWQPGMAIVDFTNKEACSWYQEKLKSLMEIGIDCFKTDFGGTIPVKDAVNAGGLDPEGLHNYYAYLYNQTVFEAVKRKKGEREALVFSRSATVGSQKFPVHWGGDSTACYASMAESLRGGLSLGLSGFGFWSHDIGGFDENTTPDLYKRWAAFGLLSSHSRLHGNNICHMPWLFDEEAVEVLRYFTKLKCRLMPYLFCAAWEAVQKGIPMLRAMAMEFEDDLNCAYLDKQYMLGEVLLIAPIFNEEGTVTYYVPEGRWTHLLTGQVIEGGSWKTEHEGYFSLPLWVRPNSILAMSSEDSRPDYDYRDKVKMVVYELDEDVIASGKIIDQEGRITFTVAVLRQDKTITVQYKGEAKPWELVLKNIHEVQGVSGGKMSNQQDGIHIMIEEELQQDGSIICYL